jgi:N-acetylmuramoyl-L-alanine amidase
MRLIDKIIVHCSDSDNPAHDDISIIRKWHTEKGFTGPDGILGTEDDVGYHAFIKKNGQVQQGRPDYAIGAHCENHNKTSLGVCLSGKDPGKFTQEQWDSLEKYLIEKTSKYELDKCDIYGHEFFDKKGKTCPNFDWKEWLKSLSWD